MKRLIDGGGSQVGGGGCLRPHQNDSSRPKRTAAAPRRSKFLLSAAGLIAVPALLVIGASLITGGGVSTEASPAAAYWLQVNQDGFGFDATGDGTELLVFGEHLYAANKEDGLFRMDNPVSRDWTQIVPPSPPAGPGPTRFLKPFGSYLYAYPNQQLWWVQEGADLTAGWNQVTSVGLPGGAGPTPVTMFKGQLYGVYQPGEKQPFEIWRSADIGQGVMNWQQVVTNSFGDPTNNKGLDLMAVFNDRLYAGTDTLGGGMFGEPSHYGTGVEIWESPTGNPGTWTQVNTDGFGTKYPGCHISGPCNFAIHQVIGSWAVYQGPGQIQEYLYVGTKAHFGAEVWRYDGSGLGGWTNATPPWAGPCPICGAGRNEDMAVFQDSLYLAEGFPTANLEKYDGANWSTLEPGPSPFDPDNGGLKSLAVHKGKLYVTTIHDPYSGVTQGDQVWGFPFAEPSLNVPGQQHVQYSDPLMFSVSASDPDDPPDSLRFSAAGLCDGLALIDNLNGTASVEGAVQSPAGTCNAEITVTDPDGLTDADTVPIVVGKEDATLAYTGDTMVIVNSPVVLRASVCEMIEVGPWPGDITKAAVFFDVTAGIGGGTTTYGPVWVSASGEAALTLPTGLPANVYSVDVRMDPANGYYQAPPADTAALVVYDPSAGFTVGGGWVMDGGAKGNFGFSVKYLKKANNIQGQALYVYRSGDVVTRVKSNAMQWLVISGNTAVFRGKATVNGAGNYTFEITVVDNGEPGNGDTFAIKIRRPDGTLLHEVPATTLGGGNVVVPQPAR